ncbi:peptidase S1 [Pseudoroseicyclus sp. CXY001]|uniref:peptidase S1 n=1 Tax=Pseudoroseicyclus sp. CXY001 TaxID=3242492 RepID=UPI00357128EB
MLKKFIVGLVLALGLGASAAQACPDWRGAPYFGEIRLNAGFVPDPYRRNITAGGTQSLAGCLGQNWAGYTTSRPDFDLYWTGSSSQLTIAVQANVDSILLVSAPDGTFWYNDDANGFNPAITFSNPQQGLYDIWIGTYDGSRRNPGQLVITELNSW